MANYSFTDPAAQIADGAVIAGGNFSQMLPDTAILAGKTLTITGGNWTNVRPQPGWTITGGNWTTVNYCSHLHPEFVVRGLPRCPDDCRHATAEEITVDGVVVAVLYAYTDEVH